MGRVADSIVLCCPWLGAPLLGFWRGQHGSLANDDVAGEDWAWVGAWGSGCINLVARAFYGA